MTIPSFPAPTASSAPNVPGDLGTVALAYENQALAQYNAYNTGNNPSATSIETRLTAIDDPSTGTAQALDARITTLNTAITTWTAGVSSNLATQVARTTAFGPRQNGHDSLMTSINASLAGYEPTITSLQNTMPVGLVASVSIPAGTAVTGGSPIANITFNARANAVYRVVYTGTFLNQASTRPTLNLSLLYNAGSSGSTGGSLAGTSQISIPTTAYFPISLAGLLTGLSPGQYTISLVIYTTGTSGSTPGALTGVQSMYLEDLGV